MRFFVTAQFLDYRTYGFTDADLNKKFSLAGYRIGAASAGVMGSGSSPCASMTSQDLLTKPWAIFSLLFVAPTLERSVLNFCTSQIWINKIGSVTRCAILDSSHVKV